MADLKTRSSQIAPLTPINNSSENKNPSMASTQQSLTKVIIPAQEKKNLNKEEIFRDRAISFLKGIKTGSPELSSKTIGIPEPLQLVPSDTNLNPVIMRNQEEDLEICKVQAWVTSGVIKKSYQHCILEEFVPCTERSWINLNEYPGRIIPSPIKDEMNNEFKQSYPFLDAKLTLSKLVNLREDLITEVWKQGNYDPVTLAIGFTLFDRLLNMNLVNKENRKLYAAVCVLLAFKLIEETHLEEIKESKSQLMQQLYRMDKHDYLTARMILETEFSVYSYLNFSLHLKHDDIKDNLSYIISRLNQ